MKTVSAGVGLITVLGLLAQPPARQRTAPTFACGQESFGPGFLGANIETTIQRLKASPLSRPKSEFETTKQYNQRIEGAGERFVILIPRPDLSYDADANTMTVGLALGAGLEEFDEGGTQFLAFNLVSRITRLPNYVGSNAFGVTRVITSEEETVYGLAFAPPEDINDRLAAHKARMEMDQMGGPAKLRMTPEEARTVKPFIRLAAVIQTKPRIHERHAYVSPTLTSPHERSITGHYLQMVVERLVVFDSRTGKVLNTLPDCTEDLALKAEALGKVYPCKSSSQGDWCWSYGEGKESVWGSKEEAIQSYVESHRR